MKGPPMIRKALCPSPVFVKHNHRSSQEASRASARALFSAAAVAICLAAAPLSAQNPATTVSVDANANQHPINPNIYGLGGGPTTAQIAALNAPLNRIGGNNTSDYNWQLDAMNLDADWYFTDYLQDGPPVVPGASYDIAIQDTRNANVGSEPMVTIPMLPYIANSLSNANTNTPSLWSYSIAKYGPQVACGGLAANDPYESDAGSGCLAGGGYVANDPTDAYVSNNVAIETAFVQHLVDKWGLSTTPTGVKYYVLDNEPSLWSSTHRDAHPIPETYDEEYYDIVDYALGIRSVDPNAKIVGPEEWIWWAMWNSGMDQKNGTSIPGSDYSAHNDTYYYPYLLQQLYAYQQKTGIKMLDVLSVHCYTDASSSAYNVATRELWDPNYVDPNWEGPNGINLNGGILEWIPLMKQWVNQYYPGLEIGCTEYDWGNEDSMSGATAQADVLGIYGLYGFDLATNWGVPPTPGFLAMQLYRNYDGKLSTFGDTSVSSTVADPDNLSAFAALRSTDNALTLMVINKQTGTTPVTIDLANFTAGASAAAYQISSATQTSITKLANVAVTGNAISFTAPSQSITLFVVPDAITQTAATPTFSPAGGSFTAPASVTISDTTSGATIYYTTNNTTPTTSSTKFTSAIPVSATTTIQAIAAASGYNNSAVASATYLFQQSQTISFPTIGGLVQAKTTIDLSATASSGLTVSFASTTPSVCTVFLSKASMLTSGNCGITASQAGNSAYAAAPPVSQVIDVAGASQSISFIPPNPSVANTTITLSATASSGLPVTFFAESPSVCTVSGNEAVLLIAGGCTLIATQAGNNVYSGVSVEVEFTVTKASQTITFPRIATQLVGTPLSLSATASSGLPVAFKSTTAAVCTVSGSTATFIAAGTCSIDVTQGGNATFAAAPPVGTSFIAVDSQTITFPAITGTHDSGSSLTLSATASSGLAVAYKSMTASVCSVSGSTASLLSGGTCTIQASQAGNSTYAAAPVVSQSFTVNILSQTITFPKIATQTEGTTLGLMASASSGLPVSFKSTTPAVCTLSGSTASFIATGTCSIDVTQSGNSTYAAAPAVGTSFIVVDSQTINFPAITGTQNAESSVTLAATASSGLAVAYKSMTGSVCTVSGSAAVLLAGGTCTIQASQAGNRTYAAAPFVTQSFTVSKLTQTITFGRIPTQTEGTTLNLVASASSGLPVTFLSTTKAVCTVSGSTASFIATGTCSIDVTQSGNPVYAGATPVGTSFIVNP
jgi:Glycoside hydrolase family 44/Chitobiase/beta-hexosaminidase C-terminal domain